MNRVTDQPSRRQFLGWVVAVGGGSLLAACTPAPAATPAPAGKSEQQKPATEGKPAAEQPKPATEQPKPATPPAQAAKPAGEVVNLRLVAWADVQDKTVYEGMVAAIAQSTPRIKATVEQYPGQYYEKVQANFAGNNAADVIYYQGWQFQPYAEAGVLSELDDLIKRDNLAKAWPEIENYKINTAWQGKTYMSPTDVGSLVIYYNKDLFDKKGIPYPKAGWTFEDFKMAVEGTTFEEGGVKYYGWAQAGGWDGAYGRSVVFMRMNGSLEWDRVIEPTKANWTQPDIIDALQYTICDVIKNGYGPGPSIIAGGGVSAASGRVAMVTEGPWYLPQMYGEQAVKEPEGINFDVVEPPVGKAGYNFNFAHIHGHTIAKQTKIRDEAWEVMRFILGDEGQKIIVDGGRMCGAPENIEKLWAPNATKTYNFQNTGAFINGMKQGTTPVVSGAGFPIDSYGGAATPVSSAWEAMMGLQKTAKQALEDANPEIQKLLDQYWAKRKQ